MFTLAHLLFLLLGLLTGILAGAVVAWLFQRGRIAVATTALEVELKNRDAALAQLQGDLRDKEDRADQVLRELHAESTRRSAAEERNARIPNLEEAANENTQLKALLAQLRTELDEQRKAAQEKIDLLNHAKTELSDAFKALSADALRGNNQVFMDLAKSILEKHQEAARTDLEKRQSAIQELIKPVTETLGKVDSKIQEIEERRLTAYSTLTTQVISLNQETSNLVKALRTPIVRGRWGEIQLKRVVEIAGMLDHVDFEEQPSTTTETGRLRPDMKIRLPNGKTIIVDSKVPLEAYLDAMQSNDDQVRQEKLRAHARQLREHFAKLNARDYAGNDADSPEFVVLFLPGESFFSAALEQDPGLIEDGVRQNIILSTPTTLIALLKAVAYGWTQERIAQSAQQISELGRELHKRIRVMASHFEKIGRNLDSALDAYNAVVGSLESRVLPQARKFTELGAGSSEEINSLSMSDKKTRPMILPSEPDGEKLLNPPAD